MKTAFKFLVAIIFLALKALFVMWLWNFIIPEITGFTTLTYWKALALSVLCGLLFKEI